MNIFDKNTYKFFLMLPMISFVLTACTNNNKPKQEIDYDFGIITTNTTKERSWAQYYKYDGTLVQTDKLKLQWLGSGFGKSVDNSTHLFMRVNNRNGTIVKFDKSNGDFELLNLLFNPTSSYVDEEYLYLSGSKPNDVKVHRYNLITGELLEKPFPWQLITSLYKYKDKIYFSAEDRDRSKKPVPGYIYILNKDFDIEQVEELSDGKTPGIDDNSEDNKIDMSATGIYKDLNPPILSNADITSLFITGIDNKIYFPMQKKFIDGTGKIKTYDINTKEFGYLELENPYPHKVYDYKDSILVAHHDLHGEQEAGITFINKITNEQKYSKFDHNVSYTELSVEDDILIAFISMNLNKKRIRYAYVYSLPDLNLINKISVDPQDIYTTKIFFK